ncbi:hypothetical protein K7G82_18280 [Sphingomonas colocasiae]|uniref:Uncharacterized protein n=1 Tax=Sphingomonas colocasiae TaxID=1848973 RepID=A0ABS7PSE2_9SPHN|nr:hypothetical protein [Sphingomonas colocasiae]
MTMPKQTANAHRPIVSDMPRPAARADLLATYIPPHQPRATLPNRVFRGG